nr:immunoglobulin heavy chain junction region [Mus musculus]
CARQGRGFAYW